MTWSAPIDRTSCCFDALHTPVTSAPNDLAICTANVPIASSCADDQDLLPGLDTARVTQGVEGGEAGHRDAGRLFERDVRRFGHQVLLRCDRVLGERAGAAAEDLVADPELRHVLADGVDDPGHVSAPDTELRSAQPETRPDDVGHAVDAGPVGRVHGGRANAHEHLVVLDRRLVDVLELQALR